MNKCGRRPHLLRFWTVIFYGGYNAIVSAINTAAKEGNGLW